MGADNQKLERPDYGVDAPNVLRTLFVFGILCGLMGRFGPRALHIGQKPPA